MPTVCYHDTAATPRAAAEAFALAGVIRARDFEIYDPETQLAGILRRADRRCLLWRFPTDRGDAVEGSMSADDLAEIWRRQTEHYLAGGGCRLRMLAQDLGAADCLAAISRLLMPLADLQDAGQLFDWRDVPASVVASVTIFVPREGARNTWHWPLRVVATGTDMVDPGLPPFARGLAKLGSGPDFHLAPDLRVHRGAPGADLRAPDDLAALTLQVLRPPGPGGMSRAAGRISDVSEGASMAPERPEALLDSPEEALPSFVTDFVYLLSHDAPPDVALFEAWARLDPRPETPLVLLAPGLGFYDDMEEARISKRVAFAAAYLGEQVAQSSALLEAPVIDLSSGMADAFGLPRTGAVPIAEVHGALMENILTDRIRFDHESDTGENLGTLMSEIERVAMERPDRVTVLPDRSLPRKPFFEGDPFDDILETDAGWSDPGTAERESENFEEERFATQERADTLRAEEEASRSFSPLKESVLTNPHSIPVTATETERYLDPSIYHDHYAIGDRPDPAKIVPDDEPLEDYSPYTLAVAIRAERIGIDREADAPAVIVPARRDRETVTVYARVEALDDTLLRFQDGFLPLEWPFDSNSEPAFFRFETGRGPRGRNMTDIEVLIYSAGLQLLEVMTIRGVVVGDTAAGHVRHKHFPEDRPTALVPAADEEPVSLSLRIKGAPSGYTAEAIFRVGPYRLRPIPLGRTIPSDDIRALLVRVRDFWTGLVVGDLSVKDRLLAYKYKNCLDEMWRLGGVAWRLFFGNDRHSGGATLGELIRSLDLPADSRIQITCRDDARHFVFPWALMRPDPGPGTDPVPEAFWGLRHVVEQLTRKGARNLHLAAGPVRVASVIDPGFDGLVAHRKTLEAALERDRWASVTELATQADCAASLSDSHPAQLYYFFCQGFTPGQNSKLAADSIKLLREMAEGTENQSLWDTLLNRLDVVPGEATMFFGTASISETELNEIAFFQGRTRPIVFLNMCHSADLLPGMGHGLSRRFIERNAAAVVGTECPMTAVFADLFAGRVLNALADHRPIGLALLEARRHFHAERNPLGFAYTLYGRSDARLGPGPAIPIPALFPRQAY